MKKKKNLLCFVLLISLIFTMAFGSVTVSAAPKLNRTKVTLLKGEKTTLKVTGTRPVSYTHLDVYKRQAFTERKNVV